jgi:Zn-dependent protease with chaperone function
LRSQYWSRYICAVLLLLLGAAAPCSAAGLSATFERTLGAGTAPSLVKEYGGEYILPIQERLRVEEVFARLAAQSERQDVQYTLTVLNSREANAFSLPGGFIFITRGLLNLIGSDEAQLAAVLGHEIAHVEKKHGVNAIFRQLGLSVLAEVGAFALDFLSGDLLRAAGLALTQILQAGWGREAEFEADALGQEIAARAGFDPVGAISLLEKLIQAENSEESMHIFRTHPASGERKKRLEENLAEYWSEPDLVKDFSALERLKQGRISDPGGRTDPRARYVLEGVGHPGVKLVDQQNGEQVVWAENAFVKEAAWSPDGTYLALLVDAESLGELWLFDRWGRVFRKISGLGEINGFCWSPQGDMLALEVPGSGGLRIVAAYLYAEAFVDVSGGRQAEEAVWLEEGLYFRSGADWYRTEPPQAVPVRVAEPVPVVLQRKRILTPTLVKEGNTFRLTRPELTVP